jgi:hypothetical protein
MSLTLPKFQEDYFSRCFRHCREGRLHLAEGVVLFGAEEAEAEAVGLRLPLPRGRRTAGTEAQTEDRYNLPEIPATCLM